MLSASSCWLLGLEVVTWKEVVLPHVLCQLIGHLGQHGSSQHLRRRLNDPHTEWVKGGERMTGVMSLSVRHTIDQL